MIKAVLHGAAAVLVYIASGLILSLLFRSLQISRPTVYSVSILAAGAPIVLFIILSFYYTYARKDFIKPLISFTVFFLANLTMAFILKPDLVKYNLLTSSNLFIIYNAMFIIFLGSTAIFHGAPENMLLYILLLCSVPAAAGIAAGSISRALDLLKARRRRTGEHG